MARYILQDSILKIKKYQSKILSFELLCRRVEKLHNFFREKRVYSFKLIKLMKSM